MAPHTSTITGFINKADLCAQLNLSRRTIDNMVSDGRFPPPVKVGKYVYWGESVVKKWQDKLLAEQESWFNKPTGHTRADRH